jgi:hypothetical protein
MPFVLRDSAGAYCLEFKFGPRRFVFSSADPKIGYQLLQRPPSGGHICIEQVPA